MKEPTKDKNPRQRPLASVANLAPASGIAVGSFVVGPWSMLAIGCIVLLIQGVAWGLKNPNEFWDRLECHISRAKTIKKSVNRQQKRRKKKKK